MFCSSSETLSNHVSLTQKVKKTIFPILVTLYKVSPVPLQWPEKSPSDSKTMDDCINSDNGHSLAPEQAMRFAAWPLFSTWLGALRHHPIYLCMSPEAIIRETQRTCFGRN